MNGGGERRPEYGTRTTRYQQRWQREDRENPARSDGQKIA